MRIVLGKFLPLPLFPWRLCSSSSPGYYSPKEKKNLYPTPIFVFPNSSASILSRTHLILLPPIGGVLLQLPHRLGQLVDLRLEVLEALAVRRPAGLQLLHLQLRKGFVKIAPHVGEELYLVDLGLLLQQPDRLFQVPGSLPLE